MSLDVLQPPASSAPTHVIVDGQPVLVTIDGQPVAITGTVTIAGQPIDVAIPAGVVVSGAVDATIVQDDDADPLRVTEAGLVDTLTELIEEVQLLRGTLELALTAT